jgi:hypothetical protein
MYNYLVRERNYVPLDEKYGEKGEGRRTESANQI